MELNIWSEVRGIGYMISYLQSKVIWRRIIYGMENIT